MCAQNLVQNRFRPEDGKLKPASARQGSENELLRSRGTPTCTNVRKFLKVLLHFLRYRAGGDDLNVVPGIATGPVMIRRIATSYALRALGVALDV